MDVCSKLILNGQLSIDGLSYGNHGSGYSNVLPFLPWKQSVLFNLQSDQLHDVN